MKIYSLLFLASCVLGGCASLTNYTGVYSCDANGLTEASHLNLADQIEEVISHYGFQRANYDSDFPYYVFFVSNSRNRVDISIRKDGYRVSIKDYKNFEETDFVRSVRATIGPYFIERCKGEVSYKRVADFLS